MFFFFFFSGGLLLSRTVVLLVTASFAENSCKVRYSEAQDTYGALAICSCWGPDVGATTTLEGLDTTC